MCMGGAPSVTPPAPPPPPPPPPPPVQDPTPVQPANDSPTRSEDRKVKGRDSLRIDLATSNPVGSSGLNIPS